MQLHHREIPVYSSDADNRRGDADLIDIEALFGIARRQWVCVLAALLVAGVLGLAYLVTAVPIYSSSINVLIDRGNGQLANQLSSIGQGGLALEDEASVLSQVEVFRSDTIALAVVDKLDLLNDQQFLTTPTSLISSVMSAGRSLISAATWFGTSGEIVEQDVDAKRQAAAARLLNSLEVKRLGRTYVLQISYSSAHPPLAARVANAFGEAYLLDKLNSKYDATRRASGWLQDRIAELRQRSLDTDLAVQRFRTQNGLVAAGKVLMADQQLSELNSALIVAQSDTAKAQARLERIQQIIASGQGEALVTDVLASSISNELRQKYLDASRREAQISSRLGSNHVQAVRLRGEMAEYQRLMFGELNRIAESYKSDLDVARAREKNLIENVTQATGISASANETQVQLRELEREAETYKNLYQTFLQRYQEAVQQQSFPVTEARVITRAAIPKEASKPNKPMLMAVFCFAGMMVGSVFGAFREFRDRFFRTADHVREGLNLEFLGSIPRVSISPIDSSGTGAARGEVNKTHLISNYAVDHPLSSFAETLRSAKLAADLALSNKRCKIIGIVSSLPSEGKSTVAINFAELLANQGNRTVLIDGDLRNPGATRAIGRHAEAGILEALLDRAPAANLLLRNPVTQLRFLPAVIRHRVPHSSELLSSKAMKELLLELSEHADYVIVDLPPLGPVVDARAASGLIDGFVFVAEWGRTARKVAKQLLADESEIRRSCLGVILNKVDQQKMKLYRSYGSGEYYYSRYQKYYQSGK